MSGTTDAARVAVLADDLIWSTRLTWAVRAAGATPVACRSLERLEQALSAVERGDAAAVDAVIVDLTARTYDGLEAIRLAAAGGRLVLAVGHHDDHDLRHRAREAGADRVLAYRALAEDGPAVVSLWLASAGGPDILRHADPVPGV